jgi:hypothetical protein
MRRFVQIAIWTCFVSSLFGTRSSAHSQAKDPWGPLSFLLGNWSGAGSGKPGEAIAGSASFSFELDKKVIIRKNRAEFAPKPGERSRAVHEDLMIIYPQQGDGHFRAIYFDNEGHVINYSISFPAKQPSAVFESEGAGEGPRFRLVYEPAANGGLRTEFFIAPPGGEFRSYINGLMKKRR